MRGLWMLAAALTVGLASGAWAQSGTTTGTAGGPSGPVDMGARPAPGTGAGTGVAGTTQRNQGMGPGNTAGGMSGGGGLGSGSGALPGSSLTGSGLTGGGPGTTNPGGTR